MKRKPKCEAVRGTDGTVWLAGSRVWQRGGRRWCAEWPGPTGVKQPSGDAREGETGWQGHPVPVTSSHPRPAARDVPRRPFGFSASDALGALPNRWDNIELLFGNSDLFRPPASATSDTRTSLIRGGL